ncbi:MAG TPA: alpha/beta fold hydrolase, partial [Actinoplanes sp.]|nr:alpha/beta fold hydrolase [Actinoplanes sp.]
MQLTTRLVAAGITGVLAATATPVTTPTAAATIRAYRPGTVDPSSAVDQDGAVGRTSAVERRRVDAVPTPTLRWYRCYVTAECAVVRLPLDYDKPRGATTEIAVLRIRARDRQTRVGSLFVNPGGPGGQGTELAFAAPYFLGDAVLRKFDIVGFDPRGVGYSEHVKCFRSTGAQTEAYAGLSPAFPLGRREEKAFLASAKAIGKGCSSVGKPLTGAMSTAETARDMEVLRRAVGDPALSYLGFSYGSAIGQYYAAMFPDRVRAIALDGVINPVSWVGTKATRNVIQDDRLRSADGSYRALIDILRRCDAAGELYCPFAAGDPVRNFDTIARTLRAAPIVIDDPDIGRFTITYATF